MSGRILSLLPSTTEIACALGFERALVGRSHECDHPPSVTRLPVLTEPKLDPGEQRVGTLGTLFPAIAGQSGGSFRVTSSRPVYASQWYGFRGSDRFLVELPIRGIQIAPQTSQRSVIASRGGIGVAQRVGQPRLHNFLTVRGKTR